MARVPGVPCTVARSENFRAQAEAIEPNYARLDEMLSGTEWTVARTDLRGIVEIILNPGGGIPRLAVRAIVLEDEAELTSIEAFPF